MLTKKFRKRERFLIITILILTSPVWIGAIVAGCAWLYTQIN